MKRYFLRGLLGIAGLFCLHTYYTSSTNPNYDDFTQRTRSPLDTAQQRKLNAYFYAKIDKVKTDSEALVTIIQELKDSNCTPPLAYAYRWQGRAHKEAGDYQKAIEVMAKAIQQFEHDPHHCMSSLHQGACYHNIAACYTNIEKNDSACFYFRKAIDTWKAMENESLLVTSMGEYMACLNKKLDYDKVIDLGHFFEKPIQNKEDRKLQVPLSTAYFYKSNSVIDTMIRDSLLQISTRKIEQILSFDLKSTNNSHPSIIAEDYHNLAGNYINRKSYPKAQFYQQKAIKVYEILKKQHELTAKDTISLIKTYQNLATLYRYQHQYKAAKKVLHKAALLVLSKQNATSKNTYLSEYYKNVGSLQSNIGAPHAALRAFQQTLVHGIVGFNDISVTALPSAAQLKTTITAIDVHDALYQKAQAWLQLAAQSPKNNVLTKKEALKTFCTLDTFIHIVRRDMIADNSKFGFGESLLHTYELALRTALANNDTLAAFHFMQSRKAAVLREHLTGETMKNMAGISAATWQEEQALLWKIATQRKALADPAQSDKSEVLQKLSVATDNWERFLTDLEKNHPIYFELKHQSTHKTSIKSIRQSLKTGMLFIEYNLIDTTLVTFVVSRDSQAMYQRAVPRNFMDLVGTFRTNISRLDSKADTCAQKEVKFAALALYNVLLKNILQDFNANRNIHRLQIIPDGVLNYIPFDALTDSLVADIRQKNKAALVWKYAISYNYAHDLMLFQNLSQNNTVHGSGFSGFSIEYKNVPYEGALSSKTEPLTHATRNIEQVNTLFQTDPANIHIEDKANVAIADLQKIAPNNQILYLNMHGIGDDTDPTKSSLIFVKGKHLETLSINDLYALPLHQNLLTVLNACETHKGKMQHGEGIMSLAQAFAYSGCKSLVAAHWSLEEDKTAFIVEHFFENLVEQNLPKDIALQLAKQQYINTHYSDDILPNHWAALVIIGNLEPIVLRK
jgi:CHAT domain-containing protein